MKRIPNAIYQTATELEAHIKAREAEADKLPPACEMRRTILREIAQLRVHAEAKRWIESPGLKPGC